MRNQLRGILTAGAAVFLVMSCKNNESPEPAPKGEYAEGVIVINGGNFGQNNGTFSFLQREGKTVVENIYNLANGQASLPPEDGRIEGYGEAGETGIILFDHSSTSGMDKAVFVNASTFEKKSELTAPAIENPRDVAVINEKKAYVTNWDVLDPGFSDNGFITVVNPESGTSIKKIDVGQGPENMVLYQKKIYVGRASFTSNQLTIVNTDTDEIVKSLGFDSSPGPVGVDAGGKLWVKEGHRLHRINTSTDVVEATLEAGNDAGKSIGAATLTADGQNIIFVLSKYDESYNEVGSTYVFNTSSPSIQVDAPVLNRVFSALGADPVSKSIYGGVTPSFTQAGYVLRVSPLGVLQDSVKVEISPEGFFFK
ncbi:MAG: hypothetical protein ABS46_03540 [Cytophagaceae bacterium SCN 52-12]|nr:MAG: hypothetical protein ABS46_03540 [Cytophagaceae bacterium SCN 52-12]